MYEYFKARINNEKGKGFKSLNKSKMLFLNKDNININKSKLIIDKSIKVLKTYQNYCNKNNIKFIFIPMPNKESIYFENAGFAKQPETLNKLENICLLYKFNYINLLKTYNDSKSKNDVYHLDDTHWNSYGVKLAAFEIKSLIDSLDHH